MNAINLRANDLSALKGASAWLTTLPLLSERFNLNKREFFDAIKMRYRWPLKYLPSDCPCGRKYTVDHAMSCAKGGFIHARHDELRDIFGNLLGEVCKDVAVEPALIPITGEFFPPSTITGDDARLDVSARGFWQRGQRAFFDVRVFNPFAPSHVRQTLKSVFRSNEKEKKRCYNNRVMDIEHGSFTPLVFSAYGGSGIEANQFISELSVKLALKHHAELSVMTNWLRTKLSFSILRSAILCIRGSRSIKKSTPVVDLGQIDISAMSMLN